MSSSSTLPPEVQAALAKGQKEGEAVVLWVVGMFCIFGWDYFMNLPAEIERIWKRKINYVSALYIANRYYGLLQFSVVIPLITTTITNAISVETCSKIYHWQPVGALISTVLSQSIMGSRVYALYGKNKIIAGILAFIMVAEFCIHTYTISVTFPAPSPAPGVVVPCVAVGPTQWLVAFWAMPLLYDTITFGLTLFKSWTFWRTQVRSQIMGMFFRDGLVYFAAIFSMNVINVVLFVTQDSTLQAVNLPATLMLNIIMSCRLVLNVREPRSALANSGPNHSGSGSSGNSLPSWRKPFAQKGTMDTAMSSPSSSEGGVVVINKTETFTVPNVVSNVSYSTTPHPYGVAAYGNSYTNSQAEDDW